MSGLIAPYPDGWFGNYINSTLHGRSKFRHQDVPGHNVFKGYSTWARNGHIGVGDAIDYFAPAGTPVIAMHSGRQTVWRNDTTKLEVIYIVGSQYTTVYAHINARFERTGVWVNQGDLVGYVRGDLNNPHVHLEVWKDGSALAADTPKRLHTKIEAEVVSQARTIKIIEGVGPKPWTVIEDANIEVADGVARGDIRVILERLGYQVFDRLEEMSKIFVVNSDYVEGTLTNITHVENGKTQLSSSIPADAFRSGEIVKVPQRIQLRLMGNKDE